MALLLFFLAQYYPSLIMLKGSDQIPESALLIGLVYGDQIELLAILPETEVLAGPTAVTLYWQALSNVDDDTSVLAELFSVEADQWDLVAEARSMRGGGLAPTGDWSRGDLYQDEIILDPPAELNGPTTSLLRIQLTKGKRSLPTSREGDTAANTIIHNFVMRPVDNPDLDERAALEQPVSFGELAQLAGLSVNEGELGVQLTLWWRAQAETETEYTVFVHVFDRNGQLVDQNDYMPNHGQSPTTRWQTGDVIRDDHFLSLRSAPGGTLSIGLYDPKTDERLPAMQNGQPLPDYAYHHSLPDDQ